MPRILYEAKAYNPTHYDSREESVIYSDLEKLREWVRARRERGLKVVVRRTSIKFYFNFARKKGWEKVEVV